MAHEDGGAFQIRGEGSDTWGEITDEKGESLWKQFGTLLWTFVWPQQPPTEHLDLVATRPQSKLDGLTQWFAWYLVPFYYACKEKFEKSRDNDEENGGETAVGSITPPTGNDGRPKSPAQSEKSLQIKDPKDWVKKVRGEITIEGVSERSLVRFTSGISTVVACLLPVVAIAVLSQVHGTRELLLCLAGFSVIFCVGLIFMTQGTTKRVEIFSATAACVPGPPYFEYTDARADFRPSWLYLCQILLSLLRPEIRIPRQLMLLYRVVNTVSHYRTKRATDTERKYRILTQSV